MATFFDAHTHPQFPLYDADREAVMSRARAAGVKMIVVGTQYATSEAAIALAKQYPGEVWATAGFHPNHLAEAWHHDKNEQGEAVPETFDPERLRLLAQEKLVVAIGECGLDFFRLAGEKIEEQKERQKEVLRAHIAIAH